MIPEDQIRFIIGIILCIPVAIVVRFFTNQTSKKYFSMIMAVLIQYYVYQQQIFLALFIHVIVYLLILFKGRKCGFFVTSISLVGMLSYHINRLIVDYGGWKIDLSMILMLYVAKYSLFAYAYEDGGVPIDKLKHQYQKDERIQQLPSFIDYFSYLQFAPTCVLNTPVDYCKYQKYMKSQGDFAIIPIQQCIIKSIKDFGISIACLAIYACEMFFVPMMVMREPEFANNNSLYIFVYSSVCIWLLKFKYYFGWKLSMISVHASGISYQRCTKQQNGDNFLGVQTCNPWTIQTTIHLRQKVNNWNITVQQWLRKCIYDRLGHSKQIGQLQTFLVSAFWHGAYGGYYLSFLIWFIQLYVSGIIYKFSSYKKNPVYKFYDSIKPYSYWLIWIIWNVTFSNNGLYFHVLSAQTGLTILRRMCYAPLIFVILTGLFFKFIPKNSSQKETLKNDNEKKE